MTDSSGEGMPRKLRAQFTQLTRLAGWTAVTAVIATCVVLTYFYRIVGDTSPLGEAVTVMPPVVWIFPLIVILLVGFAARSWKALGIGIAVLFAFIILTEDWVSLGRPAAPMTDKKGSRVITWNIAGRSDWPDLLSELELWQPDIVFLQETPDGKSSLTSSSLSGYWKDFSWWDQGDCGILSRYVLIPLESERIGPWDKPAMSTVNCDGKAGTTNSVLLCSVRMMLPAAATSPELWLRDMNARVQAHENRVNQYEKLASLITDAREKNGCDEVILGGDFNVRGGSFSLSPLTDVGLADVWSESGRGWGATFLTDFPVARIDQIWTSAGWVAEQSRTATGRVSDHRMVICEF